MSGKPMVSIIIVNYNGKDMLERYLPSVLNLDYSNYEVIVVDNGSTDGSKELINHKFESIKLIKLSKNLGFSKANNIGANAANNPDYLWFVNNDVFVPENTLNLLIEQIEKYSKTKIVVPRINYANTEKIQSIGYSYDIFGITHQYDQGEISPTKHEPHEVTGALGAALLIDHSAWRQVGGFDSENFLFGDDDYLSIRVQLLGYNIIAVPNAVVYHEHAATRSEEMSSISAYNYSKNKFRCHIKILDNKSMIPGAVGIIMSNIFHIVYDAIVRKNKNSAYHRLRGLIDGIKDLPQILKHRNRIHKNANTATNEVLDSATLWISEQVFPLAKN